MRKKDLISKRLLLYLCSAPSTQLPFHYFHSFSVFPYLVDHLLQPFLLPLLMSLKQLYQMKLGNSYSQSLLLLSSINQDRSVGLQLFMSCLILQRIWNSLVRFMSDCTLRLSPAFNQFFSSSFLHTAVFIHPSNYPIWEKGFKPWLFPSSHNTLPVFSWTSASMQTAYPQLASHVFFLLNVTIKRYTHLMSLSNAAHSSLINIFYPQLSNYFLNASQYYFPWTFSCQFPKDNSEWCYLTAPFNCPTNWWEPVPSLFWTQPLISLKHGLSIPAEHLAHTQQFRPQALLLRIKISKVTFVVL